VTAPPAPGPPTGSAAPPPQSQPPPSGAVAGLSAEEQQRQIAQLKTEKRALQVRLTAFQKEFVRTHGRRVRYREDRLPMEAEYQRYKVRCV
jgi:hypothetical protein